MWNREHLKGLTAVDIARAVRPASKEDKVFIVIGNAIEELVKRSCASKFIFYIIRIRYQGHLKEDLFSFTEAQEKELKSVWKLAQILTRQELSDYDISQIKEDLIFDFEKEKLQPQLDFSKHLQRILQKWMLNHTETPMAELLGLRLYERKIAKNTLSKGLVDWSEDGETLTCEYISITMSEVKTLIGMQVNKAQKILFEELLFIHSENELLDVQWLGLKDNLSQDKANWWFVEHHENQVKSLQTWLYDKIWDTSTLKERFIEIRKRDGVQKWKKDTVKEMELASKRFLEHMLVLSHTTGGIPPRGPEGIGMRFRNTVEVRF
ncbi:hypothetical protein FGG08_002905 [Glutinoglossum americanum]|uniref:Uncharacterized protein n=1 Tax=Glutinoglossum americanum TaxID=1670608 RepID=A0A9P8KYR9_9PEZI|nr:hypothetical protein FGG08_002905 [Glutinoglossum americanum]